MLDDKPANQLCSLLDWYQQKAVYLAKTRDFFKQRQVLEVNTPSLLPEANLDVHIDSFEVVSQQPFTRAFLQSSPELAIKRLLMQGMGDCYQLGCAFRSEPLDKWHLPEFMMLEWYRVDWTADQLMTEVSDWLVEVFDFDPISCITYAQAFKEVGLGQIHQRELSVLQFDLARFGVDFDTPPTDQVTCLNYLVDQVLAPSWSKQSVALYDFPVDQALLAQVDRGVCPPVAKRFEVFVDGQECGNGYQELQDPQAHEAIWQQDQIDRKAQGKPTLPLPTKWLADLERSPLPNCSGVAMGFDRLVALAMGVDLSHLTSWYQS
ncbi:elongation factor P lysine(34) lysyltransferase [Gammaproteobacteria bacterium]|nr:elongation factor P lysine(34) lysyltransferase [Gammaproteobacteria bacterium]